MTMEEEEQDVPTDDATVLNDGDAAADVAASTTDTEAAAPLITMPVVDVVYAVNLPNDTDFFRIDYADIEALFTETAKQLNGTRVRFHILSNDDEAIRRMTAVEPQLRVHDYRGLEVAGGGSDRSRAFLEHYVHQSVNPMEMERLCMWRWILMADYFAGLTGGGGGGGGGGDRLDDLQYIFGIDTDVALFQHPARLLSEWKLEHWTDKGFECHQVANGAAMLWSPRGLDNFADFVAAAYATREAAAQHVQEWGERFPFCRPERSLLLPCDAAAAKPEMWHMSDMDLLRAWFLQEPASRTRKEEERCLVVRQARKASGFRMWVEPRPASTTTGGAETDETDATDATATATKPTLVGIMPTAGPAGAPRVTEGPEEVCMVHFQGPQSKKLIAPFREFVERNENKHEEVEEENKGSREEFVLP